MNITLYDKIYIPKNEVGTKFYSWIQKKFIFSNPKYWAYKKNKYPLKGIPKEYVMYSESDEWLILPIGSLKEIVDYIKFYSVPVKFLDKRVFGKTIDAVFDENIVLESYQKKAFDAMVENKYSMGLLQLPPGAGKTFLALKFIAHIKTNSLILMHEERLVEQWMLEIKERLSGNFTYSIFSGNEGHNISDITVALIQSSYRHYANYIDFKKFGCVIVDETHRSSSQMFDTVLNALPAKHKYGLSGTLQRQDKMDFLIPMFLGNKFVDIPDSEVKSRVMNFTVDFIKTGCKFTIPERHIYGLSKDDNAPKDFTTLYRILTGFEGSQAYTSHTEKDIIEIGDEGIVGVRNKKICNAVADDIRKGHKVLVLTNRKTHCSYLLYKLRSMGFQGISFSTFKDSFSDSIEYKELRKGLHERENIPRIDFIVSTEKRAAEGLDITDLSSIHMTIPSTNPFKLKQCIARIRRKKEGKLLPEVRDYIDEEDCKLDDGEDFFTYSANFRAKQYKKWQESYY